MSTDVDTTSEPYSVECKEYAKVNVRHGTTSFVTGVMGEWISSDRVENLEDMR